MKKVLILMTSAILLFTGCQKNEAVQQLQSNGGDENVTFTVAVPDVMTKALADNDGHGANVNHWIMEVRDVDGDVYNRQDHDAETGKLTHTFNVTLIKGQTYNVLFWADTKGFYNTDSLTNVKLPDPSGHVANRDSLDAFSHVEANFTTTTAATRNITLKRPFAQLNVIFTDLDTLYKTIKNDTEYAKFKPYNFKAVAKIPTSFNVLTQAAGDPAATALTMTAATNYKDNYSAHAAEATLYMDYLFATAGSKDIVDIDFSFVSKDSTISHSFASIPFQRNYRTNIKGKLMTSGATFNVTVDPEWDGEIDVPYAATGSIQAANDSLAAGKTTINLVNPGDVDTTSVKFPSATDTKDVSINISGTTGKTITFEYESGAQGPANIYITTDCENLDIDTPNSHVVVNGGDYTAVEAATSATTLVIGKDVKVDSLYVTEGNIEIHGLVTSITKPQKSVVTYVIETAEVLRDVADKITKAAGETTFPDIYIGNDIDLHNVEWTPVVANCHITIDGQNHSVKNLKVTDYKGLYIGLFSSVSGATIRNLTIQNASMTNAASNGGARGGVLVGWSYACNIDNCHVINASITGTQKVAGILGAMSVEGSAGLNSVTNCSVKNLTMSENVPSDGLYQAGALVGYIQLINANPDGVLIEKNKVENITINNAFEGPDNEPYYCGTFIGSIVSKQTVDGQTIRLNNNTISGTNTALFTTIYSSPYFGWTTNAEQYSGAIAPILIDGEKWTPDYSFECGGVKYSTLEQAVNAAPSEGTVNILKAGQYQLCGISKNITVKGSVEGVVFNCEGTGSICSIPNGVTFDGLEFVFGNNNYHGFYSAGKITFNDCTLKGYLVGYGAIEYNGCIVKQETEDMYSVQVYGNDFTCNNCEFFGTNKAILVYTEGLDHTSNVTVSNCKFHASSSEDLKAAVQMNAVAGTCTGKYNTVIENCTIDGFAKVYGFKHNPKRVTATVTVDGKLVYDGTVSLSLGSAADLTEFAAAVNGGSTFEGKTVYLENDVDMTGIEWKPIGNVDGYPSTTFAGTFDGQNHTIANLTADDKTADNASSGFFGSATGTIKNLKMTNVTITSLHWAGAICGYSSNSGTVIENCHVKGGTVTTTPEWVGTKYDNGDKVGGIIGYCVTNDEVLGCSVENVTVKGYREVGGLIGIANGGVIVKNNSVKNSTVIQDNTNGYKPSIDTYGEIFGKDGGAVKENNTSSNVEVKTIN